MVGRRRCAGVAAKWRARTVGRHQAPTGSDGQAVEVAEGEEKTTSLDDIFELDPSKFDGETEGVSFEEDDDQETKKKKKEKRKKFVEIEYDPDEDVTLVKKKRKRGDESEWEEEWT